MAEEKPKEVKKPKELTQAEAREAMKKELSFFEMISNKVHHMKENNCLPITFENEVREYIERQVRVILGFPEKPTPPAYTPPPAPPAPAPVIYGQPAPPPQRPV